MNNTIIKSLIGGVLLSGTAFAGEAPQCSAPASSGFESDVTVGYDSQYMFRGVNSGNDLVTAAVNTAWTCDKTGLDMNAGAWYGTTGDLDGNVEELDLTLGASKDLGFADLNVGYIFYHYLSPGEDAQEVYFGLSKELACGTTASLTYFWDIEQDNDGYSEFALSKSVDVASKQLDLGVSTGYLVEQGQLSHVTATVSHDVKLTETATLTPYIAHSWELSDDWDHNGATSARSARQNEFFAGASLNVSF